MKIKQSFSLLKNTRNYIDVSERVLDSFSSEENSVVRLLNYIKIHESKMKYKKKDYVIDYVRSNKDNFKVVVFDNYLLPITYNIKTKHIIINLKSFDKKTIVDVDYRTIFSCLVYGICFSKLVNKKILISDSYSTLIINYLLSFFVRLFGKDYGLLGLYSQKIPKLKFLISVYILSSFFGYDSKSAYHKASQHAAYSYKEDVHQLDTFNFEDIIEFINCLDKMGIMPGLTKYSFMKKIITSISVNLVPALEDLSRFISSILCSSISGSSVIPSFIYRYNRIQYEKMVSIFSDQIFR